MEKFLYLKLGRGNCLADYWLSKENLYDKPAAAIYFRKSTAKEIKRLVRLVDERRISLREGRKEFSDMDFRSAYEFAKAGEDPKGVKFVTIKHGEVYVYEPASEIFDMEEKDYKKYDGHLSEKNINSGRVRSDKGSIQNIPKVMFVKNIRTFTKVPHVLATLPCNQYLSRGTCREIDHSRQWGAIQAIKRCLRAPIEAPKNDNERISLLGPYQLETLVFLILKNAYIFPSAWRGGTLPDIDIVGINYSDSVVKIGTNPQIVFEKMERKTFQIKRGMIRKPGRADYTIAIDFRGEENQKILTSEWLLEQVRTHSDTKKWFDNSLYWFYHGD